jgi:hypothetical protein
MVAAIPDTGMVQTAIREATMKTLRSLVACMTEKLAIGRWTFAGSATRWLALAAVLALSAPVPASAATPTDPVTIFEQLATGELQAKPSFFKICKNQTYALCATAKCTMYNEVAYCRCDIKKGDSISLPLRLNPTTDVCDVNAQGVDNGYMVSTFSLPRQVKKPYGQMALYTCPASSTGAYAQCDGGICFKSTRGQTFPGFPKPLDGDQIICSCPATVPDPSTAKVGFQIAGPYPCKQSFFANCQKAASSTNTGARIFVGAPTGVAELLALRLNGKPTPINRCQPN